MCAVCVCVGEHVSKLKGVCGGNAPGSVRPLISVCINRVGSVGAWLLCTSIFCCSMAYRLFKFEARMCARKDQGSHVSCNVHVYIKNDVSM